MTLAREPTVDGQPVRSGNEIGQAGDILSHLKKLLPPLALDRVIFPQRTKKFFQNPAKPLNSLGDLAHTTYDKSVLAYPSQTAFT
ncbi:hypothetical protein DSO57_1000867 [Entomophthora muscae]|uniref:Uncharacterized protein n=1 Tax=Entomophthora muscae TaxID=34485 RepID=A0ACC2SY02_9FUNG|nr:hypothetical protein DSO57_1000867 [Entomophthora muscae]